MPFLNYPSLDMLPGGREWRVRAPLTYIRHDGEAITVPTGFVTDLASIPRIFHSLIPVNGPHSPAAIIHDWLYETQTFLRKEADEIFLEAMRDLGVSWLRRSLMYSAVRLGGWAAWRQRE